MDKSLTNLVLIHLKENKTITSMEAFERYGATRLSAIVFNLRNTYGMNIDSVWKDGTNRYGNPVRYVEYTYRGEEND